MMISYISKDEMDQLVKLSKNSGHPYYYVFSYDSRSKKYICQRNRKSSSSRRYSKLKAEVVATAGSSLGKAMDRTAKMKRKIAGDFLNAQRV